MTRARNAAMLGVLAVVCAVELIATQYPGWGWALLLDLVACGALAVRDRAPVLAPLVAAFASIAPALVDQRLDEPATPIVIVIAAVYALARSNTGVGPAIAALVVFVPVAAYAGERAEVDATDLFFVSALTVPPFLLGRVVRRLSEQAAQLRAQQDIVRRDAIRTERDRIARDLHDVIAHSVSAMVVQTAAAQDLLQSDPHRVALLLDNVARTGREALAETGRLLHVIRDDADELGLAPAPGLARIGDLVAEHRATGLDVETNLDEPLPELRAGSDVAAYRVVQEALTNAARYATDRKVTLRVGAADGSLVIESANWSDGRAGQGSGLGLVGMAERLSILGGDLFHDTTPEGRFVLTARIPLGGVG